MDEFKFLLLLFEPNGFDEPVKWSANKCKIIINKITNVKIKCNERNRFKVTLLIENPLQIRNTIYHQCI